MKLRFDRRARRGTSGRLTVIRGGKVEGIPTKARIWLAALFIAMTLMTLETAAHVKHASVWWLVVALAFILAAFALSFRPAVDEFKRRHPR